MKRSFRRNVSKVDTVQRPTGITYLPRLKRLGEIIDNGANLTLGLVAVLAAAGAVRRRGSRSDDEWLEAVPVGYSEKPEIARLVKQGWIWEANRLNESVFGVYNLGNQLQLQGADFQGADLYMAVLNKADLEGANLRGTNLYGAKLYGANLEGANLHGANLQGADLQGAKFQVADLYEANLQGASLIGASLIGADLDEANLQGANLQGANLEGADLKGANLEGAKLHGAKLTNIYYDATTTWPRGFTQPRSRRTR